MDWRGRPSCRKQQRHSRGLPLEPVSAELIFPVTSPTFLSPSIYSEPCLLAAGSSPGAGGGGAGSNPFSLELFLSPPPDFQNTQCFFSFLFFCYTKEAYFGPVKEESFMDDRVLFLLSSKWNGGGIKGENGTPAGGFVLRGWAETLVLRGGARKKITKQGHAWISLIERIKNCSPGTQDSGVLWDQFV